MNFIYKGIAVLESKFQFEIKDWDFLTAGSSCDSLIIEFWHTVKTRGKSYHARNTKPLISGWLQLLMQMCKIIFLSLGCWLFIYWCSEDLNKQFSPNRNRFFRRTPTSQDRFDLRQLLWPDYSKYKSFDSSTKEIWSLHAVSLAVRDRQWNELPDKFKITWHHSNQPITWRP